MEEYNRYVWLAGGDPVKLARMLEIQSWFDNLEQLAATVKAMAKYLEKSEKEVIHWEGVVREYIELLLWAMEQTDSPDPIVRLRWWEYRSKMEHPPEIEGSSIYMVPFVRVPWQSEPVESLSTEPNYKRRKTVGATMLPCHPLPRRSPRPTGRLSAADE
jgi:hypothetical protein